AAVRQPVVAHFAPLHPLVVVVAQGPFAPPRARLGAEAIVDVASGVVTEVAVAVTADGRLAEVRVGDQLDLRLCGCGAGQEQQQGHSSMSSHLTSPGSAGTAPAPSRPEAAPAGWAAGNACP